MKTHKISIIIPIYNAELFLKKCINSVLNQTFENFELLLINDGSTDNSGAICDGYAQKDKRVKVFHQANAGVNAFDPSLLHRNIDYEAVHLKLNALKEKSLNFLKDNL